MPFDITVLTGVEIFVAVCIGIILLTVAFAVVTLLAEVVVGLYDILILSPIEAVTQTVSDIKEWSIRSTPHRKFK